MILGIHGIEESSVYQAIFAKGRAEGEVLGRAEGRAKGEAIARAEGRAKGFAEGFAEGEAFGATQQARKSVLRVGRQNLGPPDERALTQIADMTDLDRVQFLLDHVLKVESWDDLLAPLQSSQ
ncbi:MAG: hypothetical protein ACHRXM_07365 [Isosphaerales bacterium]